MTLLATEEPPLRRRIISSAVFIRKQRLYLSASIHFPLNPLSFDGANYCGARASGKSIAAANSAARSLNVDAGAAPPSHTHARTSSRYHDNFSADWRRDLAAPIHAPLVTHLKSLLPNTVEIIDLNIKHSEANFTMTRMCRNQT